MSRTAIPTYTTSQVIDAAHANTYWADNEAAHWEEIAAIEGSFELIEKITLPSAAQFRFLDIPQTYRHLRLYWHLKHNSPSDEYIPIHIKFNEFGGTGGGTYNGTILRADDAGEVVYMPAVPNLTVGWTPTLAHSSLWANGFLTIYDYATTEKIFKAITTFNACKRGTTTDRIDIEKGVSIWNGASAIVTITGRTQDSVYSITDFTTGSIMWLYGLL